MSYLVDLFTNKVFLAPAIAWLVSQLLKVIINIFKGSFNKERLCEGGGMPSSHTAVVTALMLITAQTFGTAGFEFVMAFLFGIMVIYDARGVRFETQRQGKALNNLNDERTEEGKQPLDIIKFKEKMGHTIPEIVIGMVIGIVCALIIYHI